MSQSIAAAENSGRQGRGTEPGQETGEEQPGAGEGQVVPEAEGGTVVTLRLPLG